MTLMGRMLPRRPSEHVGMPLNSIPFHPLEDWSQVDMRPSNLMSCWQSPPSIKRDWIWMPLPKYSPMGPYPSPFKMEA